MIPFNPRDYQRTAVEFLFARRYAGLFADPGSGKTAVSLTLVNIVKAITPNTRTLIVAPLEVCYYVWPLEVAKWSDFSHLTTRVLHGETKSLVDADIHLINPEGLPWLLSQRGIKYDLLIIDESTKFKSSNSQRFRLLKKNLKRFPGRRYILTGTPQPNSIEDLWTQIYLLDEGKSLGTGIVKYRETWMDVKRKRNKLGTKRWDEWVAKSGAAETIARLLSPFVLRLDMTKYRDIPKLNVNNIPVILPPKAKRVYDRAHKEFLLALKDNPLLIRSQGAKYVLCCQLANGMCYDINDKSVTHHVHDAKINALSRLVDELYGKPVLIAYHFKHDLLHLRKHFKRLEWFRSDKSKNGELIRRWNAGEIPMLAAQASRISHGLNLQYGGSDIVWYSLTDKYGDYEQFNRRIHGRDNLRPTRVHRFAAKGTVDEGRLLRLDNKQASQAEFLSAIAKT